MKFAVAAPHRVAAPRQKLLGLLGAVLCVLLGLTLSAHAATFTVVNNNDSGAGSLRQAILDTNTNAGADTIVFNVASFTIAPITPFASISGPVTIDGTSQPGYSGTPIIVLDGSGAGAGTDGLAIRGANCAVKGLTIQNYSGNGISIAGASVTGCSVTSCRIGTNSAGTVAAPNNNGVAIFNGAKNNIVGGTFESAGGNLISGNTTNGVLIFGAGTDNNTVLGNRIGTNASGGGKVGNATGAIIFGSAKGNHIGTAAGGGNLISGNTGAGIQIFNAGTNNNTVEHNAIGTNESVSDPLGNGSNGVQIFDNAQSNTIGGTSPDAANFISGNTGNGVLINNVGTSHNTVAGNFIGTNPTGFSALPNGGSGVQIQTGATENIIGNTLTQGRNVISGNTGSGVKILDDGTDFNLIKGNYIGTNVDGTAAIPNGSNGVEVFTGPSGTAIGLGLANTGNIISGNIGSGILLFGAGTSNTNVKGNKIGTNAAGTAAIANGTAVTPREGVYVSNGAESIIGGSSPGDGNLISGNTGNGISVSGAGSYTSAGNNRIGTNAAGNSAIPNGIHGVEVRNGGSGTIGEFPQSGTGQAPHTVFNTIAFNTRDGVRVSSTSDHVTIRDNAIFQNGELGINLSGGAEDSNNVTSNDVGDGDTGANTLQNYPLVTTASRAGNTLSVAGTLNSTPNTKFIVELFGNTQADPSGAGEGQDFLGGIEVTTNASGNANISFSGTLTTSPAFISATATNFDRTSEFSLTRAVTIVPTYSITGRLTNSNGGAGIANVSVALSGNSTGSVTTNASGDYVFNNLTAGSYTVTPSASAGYSFTPASRNVSLTNANVTGQNFTGVATSARIIGRISDSSGVAISGVAVTRTGSATPVTTNSAGYYTFTGANPGTYTVTPSKTGYTFAPVSRSVTLTGGDVTGQNFIGRNGPPPPATYQIIGRIGMSGGTGVAGVTVTRTGSATSVVTNSAGYYTFTGVPNGTYTVTPTKAGYVFSPTSRSVTVNGADSINNSFVAATGYRIVGRIATSNGVAVAGVSVTRSGSATPVVTNSAGYYQFENVPNGTYTVTPSLSGRTFTPAARSVTVNSADTIGNNFIASN